MSNFYEQLCQTFIRPSRQVYNVYDLGQPITQKSRRIDFHVFNNRQQKIMCSYYTNLQQPFAPCIVYLHSLNGSRLESLPFVQKSIKKGFNFCSFDFAGTGLSQGKYVSLGYFEKFDILVVLQYLSQNFNIRKFILWGRSMGAAATIKFMSLLSTYSNKKTSHLVNFQISAIILDSPFHSLSELTIKIAKQKINIPQIFIKAVLLMVQSTIQSKAGFKISQMEMLNDVKQIKCPILLLTSKEDKLVSSCQSQKIYQTITHKDRQIVFITGQHNSNRDNDAIQCILEFSIKHSIKKKQKLEIKQNFAKSNKIINYRGLNSPINNSIIGTRSFNKLENNSFQFNKYDTCGDEQLTSGRRDDQMQNWNMGISKNQSVKLRASQFKRSLNVCSNKVVSNQQIKYQNRHQGVEVKFVHYKPVSDHILIAVQKKSPLKQLPKKEVTFQYQSQKKIASVVKNDKCSFQINKSPIKEPPKLHSEKKIPQTGYYTPASKYLNRKENQLDVNRSTGADDGNIHVKTDEKVNQIRKNVSLMNPNSIDKKQLVKDLNHFNIINEKLKRKKKKQIPCDISPRIRQAKEPQVISVSIERKSQIPIKSPPQFIRNKIIQQMQSNQKSN